MRAELLSPALNPGNLKADWSQKWKHPLGTMLWVNFVTELTSGVLSLWRAVCNWCFYFHSGDDLVGLKPVARLHKGFFRRSRPCCKVAEKCLFLVLMKENVDLWVFFSGDLLTAAPLTFAFFWKCSFHCFHGDVLIVHPAWNTRPLRDGQRSSMSKRPAFFNDWRLVRCGQWFRAVEAGYPAWFSSKSLMIFRGFGFGLPPKENHQDCNKNTFNQTFSSALSSPFIHSSLITAITKRILIVLMCIVPSKAQFEPG